MFATALARWVVVGVVLAASVGISWYAFSSKYYNKGWNAAIHAIAVQNAKAVEDADNAKKDVDACFASGGDWDVTDGSCLHKH